MNISTTIAVLCLAASAGAQTKAPPAKSLSAGGYYPPPGGSQFLVVGGSDNCGSAAANDAISGFGTFSVTTVGASPDGPGHTCPSGNRNVWFYWTATTTGATAINTCGGVTSDSVLAVWDGNGGACPVTELACNDDACGLQSEVTFAAVAGSSYFIELGAYGPTTTYSGTFSIGAGPTTPPNDDCANPIAITGGGVYPFDNRLATTGTQGQTEPLCLAFNTTSIHKDSWWTYTPSQSGTVQIDTCGQVLGGTDTRIAAYLGTGCPTSPAIACNDDACGLSTTITFAAVCGQPYIVQIGNFSAAASLYGTFTITESGTSCGPTATAYCFGDGSGTPCPCGNSGAAGNGCASSVNANGANLAASGVPSISNDTFVLLGTGMPNSSALYYQGTGQTSVAFGDGLRCVSGQIRRLGTKSNQNGSSQYPAAGDQSISIRGANSAGDVRNYQVWYRNAAAFCTAATFNLSNGVQITWTP